MKKTNIYGFGYLEPGDLTSELLDLDQRRFNAIENNIQHLFQIFGNGILVETGNTSTASWEIRSFDANTLAVYITPGEGHIAWKYCKTTQNVTVNLPLSSNVLPAKFWIYATANETTPEQGTVTFIASLVEVNDPINYVGLGAVTVEQTQGESDYTFIIANNAENGRVVINLFNTLASRVNAHKHVGGTRNPSPIDLSAHVQGKLSGDFISDLDASKITKGVLAVERLPQIDHSSLARKGTLSHTEIDSLLADLTYPTGSRLSDLFVVNMLQLTMALKKQSGLSTITNNLVNVIMYQPGYNATDSFVSYYSTWAAAGLVGVDSQIYVPTDIALAQIDKVNHRIIGGSPTSSATDNVFWKTDVDFKRAFNSTIALINGHNSRDVEIGGVGNAGYFTLTKPSNFKVLADKETTSFTAAKGWTFARKTTYFPYDPANPNAPQFETNTFLFKYFKDGNNNDITLDFNDNDKLGISYSVINASNDVYLYLITTQGGTLVDFTVDGNTNNVKSIRHTPTQILYTTNTTGAEEDLKAFNIDAFLSSYTSVQKSEVIGFGFKWLIDDDLIITFPDADQNTQSSKLTTDTFKRAQETRKSSQAYADSAVFVWNEKYYSSDGQLIIRFNDASGNSIFSTVTNESSGTGTIRISTRVANTSESLNNASFANISGSGSISSQNNKGNWIDIKISLFASTDRLSSPLVQTIGLIYTRPGVSIEKRWDTRYQFTNQGLTFTNVSIDTNESPFGAGDPITGTLNFISGNVAVTGTGTVFLSDLKPGDTIYKGTADILGVVDVVTDNANLTLVSGASVTYSGVSKKTSQSTDYLQISIASGVGNFKFIKFNKSGHATIYSANKQAGTVEEVIYPGLSSDPATGGPYTTPYQAWERARLSGIEKARDVYILDNKHAVIADTLNDRVIEVDTTGLFVRAIQGNLRLKRNLRDFVALTAYYNPRISTLYICFSQYLTILNKAKMSIRTVDQIVTFDSAGVTVSLFDPVSFSQGAGNGVNLPSNAVQWSGNKSATLKIEFTTTTLKEQIKSWATDSITVVIENDAVRWDGNDGIPYASASTGTTTNYGNELPLYLRSPNQLFKNVGGSGEFQSEKFVSFKGLKTDIVTQIDGDFNDDNILPTSTNAPLYGPTAATAPVTLKVFVGEVVMDNLFSPVSIQVLENSHWVVAVCGAAGIHRYDTYGTNMESYRIPYTTVAFIDGKGGSAYLMPDKNFENRILLVAAPARTGINGSVLTITNGLNSNNKVINPFITPGLDAVRALPDPDGLHYWVALDDVVTNGLSSKLVKFDTSGNIRLEWGSGERDMTHPVGLAFTSNGDILVSE